MSSWQSLEMRRWTVPPCCLELFSLVLAAFAFSPLAQSQASKPPRVALTGTPEPVYAQNSNDSWNRIFYYLFSRRMEVRLSDEFPEGAPFTKDGIDLNLLRLGLQVSTGTFERNEVGDRAIDPLYPSSFDGAASRWILTDPTFSEFTTALQDALHEHDNVQHSSIARALMQSDLWGAHDILFNPLLPADENKLGERRRAVVDLLARLIRKIALTPEESKSLPGNYAAAIRLHSLPDLFHKESGWIEVRWFSARAHDDAAGYRRVSRVFLKPTHPPHDLQKFLDGRPGQSAADLDGVALVMQLLLIDTQGNVRPTALTVDVQVRMFDRTSPGLVKRTSIQVCEISRKLFVRDPASGGVVEEQESSPVYAAENYTFATNYFTTAPGQIRVGPPVQIKLRTRCVICHGDSSLTQVATFGTAMPPHPPRVKQLDPAANEEADFDIAEKRKRGDFQSLLGYFGGISALGAH